MRVTHVTDGPLFADDSSGGQRRIRRLRGIAAEVTAFLIVTPLLPLLLVAGLIVDLALWLTRRKPLVAIRLIAFLWWFLFAEMRGLATLLYIKLTSKAGSERRRKLVYGLRIHWARSHIAGVRVLFGLTFEIEGLELAGPGPQIVLIRHASIIDNMLPDAIIGRHHGVGLRFVLKRELNMIPVIDIGGRWVPTIFVRRGSKDPAGEVAKLRRLADDLGPGEGVLIYPEGTRHTPAKLARAQEILREQNPEVALLADRLQNLLPPRLGGAPALLAQAPHADVVVFGHVGLDGFEYISDIWKGRLVGGTVKMKFWRHDAASIPEDEQGRIAWLYDRWQELDDWVGEQLPSVTASSTRA